MISYILLFALSAILPFVLHLTPFFGRVSWKKLAMVSFLTVLVASYTYQFRFLTNKESVSVFEVLISSGIHIIAPTNALLSLPFALCSVGVFWGLNLGKSNQ